MNNYWLDRKKPCNKKWKRIEIIVDHGEPEHLNISSQVMTCSEQDGKIFTKMSGEKSKETLEMIKAKLE